MNGELDVCILGDVATIDCKDSVELIEEVGKCIGPLHELRNISAIGALNREQWSSTCVWVNIDVLLPPPCWRLWW